ncbi:site-specific DNA-methyltransferase [Vibrio sp. 10N.261.52.A1]|uniref:site-specific DNA-methyltransferase n=1 Tax=Vibrio TaxID=662 RepID=UPI000C86477F|nr:site-specific DNA-methyltransferase [Vibrio sp. 10N.261.52.A1]PML64762.1 type III restriction endonuclease subunit M [Vibrio sp. 10N.261.52.A1]
MNIKKETVYSNVETANSKQLAILKKHFPNCFDRDGNFIQERMLEVVNDNDIELSKESYSLNWLGKSYSRLLANLPPKTLIHADVDHNAQEQHKDSKNLLIKGDNLEVLKHLVNAYSEKVKMIYIDPPYNTGSDGFVYNDDRKFTKEQLADLASLDIDEAERILSFSDQGSSSHSAWLTFIYPRLYVARELLQEDGVIAISIDENEFFTLRTVMNEIFGESNYCGEIVWKNTSKNDQKYISFQHEYILVYTKSKNGNEGNWTEKKGGLDEIYKAFDKFYKQYGDDWSQIHKEALAWYKGFPQSSPVFSSKHYNWMDKRGVYFASDISGPNDGQYVYDVLHPVTQQPCKQPSRGWFCPESKMLELIKQERIHFGEDHTKVPNNKTYLKETENQSLTSLRFTDSRASSKRLSKLMGGKVFTNPKDELLLAELMKALGVANEDIVLDFFAGSGTTAHSIWYLNEKEAANLKFVLVQLDEKSKVKSEAYKAGYLSIFDVTKERLNRTAKMFKEEVSNDAMDLGFQIFETVEDFRIEEDDKELTLSNLTMFDDVLLTDEQYQTLLTTWALYDGSELTTPIYDIDLDGYTAHLCDRRLYMIAPNFSSNALKALLHKLDDTDDKDFDPNKIVYYANNFDSVKQMELNEALKSYANKKSIEIDVVVRN